MFRDISVLVIAAILIIYNIYSIVKFYFSLKSIFAIEPLTQILSLFQSLCLILIIIFQIEILLIIILYSQSLLIFSLMKNSRSILSLVKKKNSKRKKRILVITIFYFIFSTFLFGSILYNVFILEQNIISGKNSKNRAGMIQYLVIAFFSISIFASLFFVLLNRKVINIVKILYYEYLKYDDNEYLDKQEDNPTIDIIDTNNNLASQKVSFKNSDNKLSNNALSNKTGKKSILVSTFNNTKLSKKDFKNTIINIINNNNNSSSSISVNANLNKTFTPSNQNENNLTRDSSNLRVIKNTNSNTNLVQSSCKNSTNSYKNIDYSDFILSNKKNLKDDLIDKESINSQFTELTGKDIMMPDIYFSIRISQLKIVSFSYLVYVILFSFYYIFIMFISNDETDFEQINNNIYLIPASDTFIILHYLVLLVNCIPQFSNFIVFYYFIKNSLQVNWFNSDSHITKKIILTNEDIYYQDNIVETNLLDANNNKSIIRETSLYNKNNLKGTLTFSNQEHNNILNNNREIADPNYDIKNIASNLLENKDIINEDYLLDLSYNSSSKADSVHNKKEEKVYYYNSSGYYSNRTTSLKEKEILKRGNSKRLSNLEKYILEE